MLRQVGEGGAGWRAGATRGELAPANPVPAAHRLDCPGEIQPAKQAPLPAQLALGLIAEALAQGTKAYSDHPDRLTARSRQATSRPRSASSSTMSCLPLPRAMT